MCAGMRWDYEKRENFRAMFSYAVPTRKVILEIAKFLEGRAVLEVGAGRGLWAHLLHLEGVTVDATDAFTPTAAGYPPFVRSGTDMTYCPVRLVDAEQAASTTSAQALMLVWPPYNTDMSELALDAFGGDCVVYVGEGNGGCTGTETFHDTLEARYNLARTLQLPQWDGLHDRVMLYTRK